ncbi:MAG: AAA family ATPase [Paludibacteraceae bacterium]|nr:AAA family ATPase [Paludibacteraceae bacterium]
MKIFDNVYDLAYAYARQTNQNLFITGKAGAGKTTFLKKLREDTDKNLVVTAPTGVAAVNAGGMTLHAFFQLPLQPYIPTEAGRRDLIGALRVNAAKRRLFYQMDTLVIDEVSMVRADVMDAIDAELQYFRGNRLPFGGVQVILIGDLHQLSPVSTESDQPLLAPHYDRLYFFESRVIRENPLVSIEFDRVYRQRDPAFIELLNAIRDGRLDEAQRRRLVSLYQPGTVPENDCIVLTTHNQKADEINAARLEALPGRKKLFHAVVNGDFPEKSFATDETLALKEGARVMFLRNNQEKGYYNGKTGTVTGFEGGNIRVHCDEDDSDIRVEPEVWSNTSYTVNSTSGAVEVHVQGTFTQMPLRLAWAVTIHKSQGLTFDKVAVDAAQAFASGQVYVALSRCRSLEGLRLLSPVPLRSLQQDEAVIAFGRQLQNVRQLQDAWEAANHRFQLQLVGQLYDFRLPQGQLERLRKIILDAPGNWNEETLPHLEALSTALREQQPVAEGFQRQLAGRLAGQWDADWLQQRLSAASTYFIALLRDWLRDIRRSPAKTDSKALALEYNNAMHDITATLAGKEQLMARVAGRFDAALYFAYRKSVKLPSIAVNAYAGADGQEPVKAKYPDLYRRLSQIRHFICEATGLPVYRVASSRGLVDAATYLPLTEKDLLRLPGFGPVLVSRYGTEFLDTIREYCGENGLSTAMGDYPAKTVGKRKKKS